MLNQILSQLGSSAKTTIGVSMSPSVGLEMIEINPKTKVIEKYACKQLDYDYSKREIADYSRFIEVLGELFDELKISRKSNIILTLPAVHYGLISLPINLGDDGVTNAIISEVEQSSYIFKRQDPVISWTDAYKTEEKENRSILYGAIQQTALDEINAACVEIGCTLLAIESSPNSLLKTLSFNQLAEEQMAPNTTWNLMIINPSSYSMITMNGKNVYEYREEPLALRSFVGDEIYEAIISSAQLTIQTVPSNYLYIVSETDLVSAEVLSMKIPFDGNIKFIESNKYVQGPLMQASYNILPNALLKTTPEAIGSGIYQCVDFPFKFNLLGQGIDIDKVAEADVPSIFIGDTAVKLTKQFVQTLAIILASIIVVPSLLILYFLGVLSSGQQAKLDEINSQIETNKAELQNYEEIDRKDTFDTKLEINTVQASNRTKLIYYSAIGASLPPETWLIYLKIENNERVDIIGRAKNAEAVYEFYKSLKMSVINSDLRLNKLEMSADTVGNVVIEDPNKIKPKFYEFEITNMSEEDIQRIEDELNAVEKDENGNPKSSDESTPKRRRGFLFEDFLKQPLPVEGGNSGNNDVQQQSDSGQQSEPPKNLPANLESIEKF